MATKKQSDKQRLEQSGSLSNFYVVGQSENPSVDILGGKGFKCAQMHEQGLRVPPAIIIGTDWCRAYMTNPKVSDQIRTAIPGFWDYFKTTSIKYPLISVRSGAKVSMPGMMDTILNVGMTTEALPFWEKKIGARAARDCRRRFMQMYASVVCDVPSDEFEAALTDVRRKNRVQVDSELSEVGMSEVIKAYDQILKKHKVSLPDTFEGQVSGAVEAVFKSWNNARAVEYRRIFNIADDLGTAVVLQKMVFGNLNDLSATGVWFTRNPATGNDRPYGDFLINAQGEDVVNSTRDTLSILELNDPDSEFLTPGWPSDIYQQLYDAGKKLEILNKDAQDIEWTVEDKTLYFLQTRTAKRSALAELVIAMSMCKEGVITAQEAISRLSVEQYNIISGPMIAPGFNKKPDLEGLPASTGIVSGKAVFTSEAAVNSDGDVILVRPETSPDDLPGMYAAKGILTATGGVTSHAAVVARGMNKVCIVGAKALTFRKNKHGEVAGASIGAQLINEGDTVTMDGASGRVWLGTSVPVVSAGSLSQLVELHDMLFQTFPGILRICTDGKEVANDIRSVFATYLLDGLSADTIRREVQETMPYLNGILDLSTAMEYAPESDKEILALGGADWDDKVFEIKAQAALNYMGDKDTIHVYLGKREKEWASRFQGSGFKIATSKEQPSLDEVSFNIVNNLSDKIIKEIKSGSSIVRVSANIDSALAKELNSPLPGGLAMSADQLLSHVLRREKSAKSSA